MDIGYPLYYITIESIHYVRLTVERLVCFHNYISPRVKTGTVHYCLAGSKCMVLWEINPGSEKNNL